MFVLCLVLAAGAGWVNRAYLARAYYSTLPLERLAEARPSSVEGRLVLAERYLKAGKAAEAEAELGPLLLENPGLGEGWILRAGAELEQQKDARAYASARVAIQVGAPQADALTLLGRIEERRGHENAAEEHYRAVIEREPKHAEANYRQGRLDLSHANYGPAIAKLEIAGEARPRDPQIMQYLAQAHQELGHMPEAQRLAREAVRLAPGSQDSWFVLGRVLKTAVEPEKRAEAEAAFRQALTLEPTSAAARQELGALLFQRGEYAAAVVELERAVKEQPLHKAAYTLLAQCYARLKRPQDSARALKEYHRLEEMNLDTAPLEYSVWAMPENLPLRLKLARLYLKYGRKGLAENQVNLVLEANGAHAEALQLRAELRKSR